MKKYLILLSLMAFTFLKLFSQDVIDPRPLFSKDTLSVYDHRVNQFIFGWNWSGEGRKLDMALNMNTYHSITHLLTGTGQDITGYITEMGDSIKDIEWLGIPGFNWNDWRGLTGRVDTVATNGMSIFLEPTTSVDTSDNTFKLRWNDMTGGVYGFKYHNWSVGDTVSNGADQHRFRLQKSRLTVDSAIVLDSIWDGSILRFQDYFYTNNHGRNYNNTSDSLYLDSINTSRDINVYHPYNGKQWYLSINLRALDKSDLLQHLQDTIMSIQLPYSLWNDTTQSHTTGIIRFDSIPNNALGDTLPIIGNFYHDRRGIYKILHRETTQTTFYITGNMLLTNSAEPNNSITLSAFFKNNGYKNPVTLIYENNPPFKNDWYENKYGIHKYIDTINVRVKYFGKTDIAIDWIRLESPNMRRLMFGGRDSLIRVCLDTTFSRLAKNIRHPLLYGVYGADEFLQMQWGSQRYYNMLLDTIVRSEIYITDYPTNPPERTLKATGFKEYWTGSTPYHYLSNFPATPFFRKANVSWLLGPKTETFQSYFGYAGNNFHFNGTDPYDFSDTLNSAYETFIIRANGGSPYYPPYYKVNLPVSGIDTLLYDKISWSSDHYLLFSTQAAIEVLLRNNYYKYPKLLYNDKPWWANLWVTNGMAYDNTAGTFFYGYRPKTGEEIRLMMSSPVLLGAKGLFYYLKGFAHDVRGGTEAGMLRSPLNNFLQNLPDGNLLAYTDLNGGDYINPRDSIIPGDGFHYNFKHAFDSTKYDWDTLGTNPNRVYFGLRSTTAEIYKYSRWIKAVEPELLKLRLASWYGRGFVKLISQDSRFTDPFIFGKYIDTGNIRTKKINSTDFEGRQDYGFKDSSFYDITMFRDKDDSLMTSNTVHLSLLNRRTDPLFRYHWNPNCDTCWEMKFFSTAEFEDSCGISPDVSRYPRGVDSLTRINSWRSFWWSRQGSREFRIPFHVRNNSKANAYTILKITELGAHNIALDTLRWHQDPFMHIVDTTIAADSTLIVKMLPGEGKIFKIQIFYTDTLRGILDYSNQRKLVAYPIKQASINNFGNDTVRYHLVYHKPVSGFMKVFYRRSYPMLKGADFNQISWEQQEHQIADSINVGNLPNEQGFVSAWMNIAYPSIVVRYDTLANYPKVYVVYSFNYLNNEGIRTDYYIGENIFPANDPVVNLGISNAIYHGHGKNLDTWGTPVVNGSYPGNFYAFSDSLDGIIAGWKTSFNTNFANLTNHITNLRWNNNPENHPSHPSLNSYSRIRLHEDDCALVFQDSLPVFSRVDINYTRLRMVDDTIRSYLPTYFLNTGFPPILLDNTGKIANLSDFYGQWWGPLNHHSLPVIYRGIEDGTFSMSSDSILALKTHKDIVYWMMDNWVNYDGVVLSMRAFDITDTIVNDTVKPAGWYVYPNYWIESLTKPLSHPTISQGRSSIQSGNWSINGYISDSNVVVNFKAMPSGSANDPPLNTVSDLWQLPQGFNTLNPYSNYYWLDSADYYSTPKARRLIFKGKTPQLCALPYTRWKIDWYYNRRVFNTNDEMPPSMIASIDQFARKTEEDEETANVFIGYSSQRGTQLLTPFTLSEQNGRLTCPVLRSFKKDGDRYIPSDTITSSWFSVNNLNTIHFFTRGNGNLNANLQIERQKDGRKVFIPNAILTANKISKNRLILVNGGNHKFRFNWIKTDSTARYTESLIIANLPVDDELNSAFDSSRFGRVISYEYNQVIDLGDMPEQRNENGLSLSIYPNPADETIYTTAYMPFEDVGKYNKMTIRIFSSLGLELYRQDVKSGETITINTKEFPQGAYFIRAEEQSDRFFTKKQSPAVQGFVIKR